MEKRSTFDDRGVTKSLTSLVDNDTKNICLVIANEKKTNNFELKTSNSCDNLLQITIMPKKATTSAAVDDTNSKHEPQHPDIFRQEPPLPVKKPKGASSSSVFVDFLKPIGFLLSLALGVVLLPLLASTVILFIFVPRFIVQVIIWARYRSQGIHLLPIRSSLSAVGYEFYTFALILRGTAPRLDKIRSKFQSILDAKNSDDSKLKYPSLRRRLIKRLGYHCYEERQKIELGAHINLLEEAGDPPGQGLSQSRLFQLLQADFKCGSFKVMRADAPQWELLVVQNFKYDVQLVTGEEHGDGDDSEDSEGHGLVLVHQEADPIEIPKNDSFYALVFRAHSAILDKPSAFNLFRNELLDKKSNQVIMEEPSLTRKFGMMDKLEIIVASILQTPYYLLYRFFIQGLPYSFGDSNKSDDKEEEFKGEPFTLSATRPINLRGVQAAKNVSQTSVTAVVVACASGAARNMVLSQNKPLPTEIRLSLKQFPKVPSVSFFSETVYNCVIPSQAYAYPIDRLGHAYVVLGESQNSKFDRILVEGRKLTSSVMLWIIGASPSKIGPSLFKYFHNVHILLEIWNLDEEGNLSKPFELFGDTVVDLFAWNSIDKSYADYGLTLTTYAGRLKANIIGDNAVLGLGSKIDRNIIANEFVEEWVQLAMPCDIKPKYLFRPLVVGGHELF